MLYLHVQKPRESEGLGRQDSSGHLTLNLLPTSTTQLLAATQTAVPGRPTAGDDRDPTCSLQFSFHAILLRPSGMRWVVWLPVSACAQRLTFDPAGRKPFMNCMLTRPDMHQPLSIGSVGAVAKQRCASADNADTSGLLTEMTMASAAGQHPPITADVTANVTDTMASEPEEDILTPPAQQQAAQTPASQVTPQRLSGSCCPGQEISEVWQCQMLRCAVHNLCSSFHYYYRVGTMMAGRCSAKVLGI